MMSSSPDVQEQLLTELAAIDKAYGKVHVDLYKHVLKTSPQSSPPELQKAFFVRRQELFGILSDDSSPLFEQAEKQMDALVLTYRILGDAVMRIEYDAVRAERRSLRKGSKKKKPRTVTPEKPNQLVTPSKRHVLKEKVTIREDGSLEEYHAPKRSSRRSFKKTKRQHVVLPSASASFDDSTVVSTESETLFSNDTETLFSNETRSRANDTYATETVFTAETDYTTLTKRGKSSFILRVTEEIEGCVEDTLSAFDQVFNVFTLEEKDIRAVTNRIEKAKRELNG